MSILFSILQKKSEVMTQRSHFQNIVNGRRRHHRVGGRKPEVYRNIPSAFFGLVATGLYIVSMAEPNWFRLEGGACSAGHLGLYVIFGSHSNRSRGTNMFSIPLIYIRIF